MSRFIPIIHLTVMAFPPFFFLSFFLACFLPFFFPRKHDLRILIFDPGHLKTKTKMKIECMEADNEPNNLLCKLIIIFFLSSLSSESIILPLRSAEPVNGLSRYWSHGCVGAAGWRDEAHFLPRQSWPFPAPNVGYVLGGCVIHLTDAQSVFCFCFVLFLFVLLFFQRRWQVIDYFVSLDNRIVSSVISCSPLVSH